MRLLPPPGPERRRQLTRLVVILGGLAVVLWYQFPTAGPAAPASNVPVTTTGPHQAMRLPEPIRLGDLEDAPEASAIGRNPFSFGIRPVAEPAMQFTAPPVDFSPTAVVPEGPPPIALRLTSLMVSPGSDRTMATLKDPVSGALFHAFEGDVVDGRYRVVKVGQQSVVVSYLDGSSSRTLGLGN